MIPCRVTKTFSLSAPMILSGRLCPSCVLNRDAELFHIPVLDFTCSLHLIDVHPKFVFNIRRGPAGLRLEVLKDDASPVRFILQELQRFAHQMAFRGDRLKLVQVQTLSGKIRAMTHFV